MRNSSRILDFIYGELRWPGDQRCCWNKRNARNLDLQRGSLTTIKNGKARKSQEKEANKVSAIGIRDDGKAPQYRELRSRP